MTKPANHIVVTRSDMLISRQARRPLTSHYACTGPDGRRFDNRSLVELRDVLRRHYGSVQVTVVDA